MSFVSSSPKERREQLAEYLSESDVQEALGDYVKGLLTGGITSGYATIHALARGDWEEVAYWFKVEAAVLGTQYVVLQMMNYLQGAKYAMSFHRAHASMGPARGLILRGIFVNPTVQILSSTVAQAYVWDQIGDPMTGATHYSGAGTMSGGSMPVIPGTGGDHTTWFDFGDWWESL